MVMQKITLGTSEIEVSRLCLGTMYFGTKVSKQVAFDLLDYYYDQGGNFVDTANNYAWWIGGSTGDESELLIGEWITRKGLRDKIVLCSKVGSRPKDLKNGDETREGLKKETILRAVEDSLKRLKTDYLDLCYVHADLENYPLEERLEALELLQKEGKILSKGCSNITATRLTKSLDLNQELEFNPIQAVQQKYSYLLPNQVNKGEVLKFLDEEMIQIAREQHLSLLIYSVLLSGAYEKGFDHLPEQYLTKMNAQKINKLEKLSCEIGRSKSELVLHYLLRHSPQIIPIISASNLNQLQQNIQALSFKSDYYEALQ